MGLLDKIIESQYYSLNNILKAEAHYNVIFGERSNGKTYAVLKYAIEKFFENGSQLAIVRRWQEDFIGKRGASMFEALSQNGEIARISNGEYNAVYYFSSRWYFAEVLDGKVTKKSDIPFAYGFAITSGEHDKSTSYPSIRTVLFDEFISRAGYVPDEFVLFMNVLSTIIRERDDVKIFMLGNTINKYCPYFAEMGLTNVKQQKQGTIDIYKYGNSKLTVAVEYCHPRKNGKKSDVYFAFNNPKLSMVTTGDWEIQPHPHLPYKYMPKEVLFSFLIKFEGDTLKGDVVMHGNDNFIYIYPKTTDVKCADTILTFSQEYSTKPNYRRSIFSNVTRAEQMISKYFTLGRVFYATNETGEVVWNFLEWCRIN